MFNPQMELLASVLAGVLDELGASPSDAAPWTHAQQALAATRTVPPVAEDLAELGRVLEARDLAALGALVEGWRSGKRLLPQHDRDVLARAMKAFRKSLKVTRLDAESSIGGGPMSAGRNSSISGMRPPERYPRAVWEELARQKRLISVGHGIYELPPE